MNRQKSLPANPVFAEFASVTASSSEENLKIKEYFSFLVYISFSAENMEVKLSNSFKIYQWLVYWKSGR